MSGREDKHVHALPMVNPFVGEVIAARYAWARPQLHHHVVALLAERLPAPIRALDLDCGTGLSTEPLTSWARLVVGVDVSLEMLVARPNHSRARYVQALAERLPFRDRSFDPVTSASAIHWFGSDAIGEIGRVLNRRAFLVVYDVQFRAEMSGTEAFGAWMNDECGQRYGPVPKNEFAGSSVASIGFQPSWEADLHFDVPMPLDALVAYLMTHSERIAAVREARETEVQQETYIADALRPFFSDAEVASLASAFRLRSSLADLGKLTMSLPAGTDVVGDCADSAVWGVVLSENELAVGRSHSSDCPVWTRPGVGNAQLPEEDWPCGLDHQRLTGPRRRHHRPGASPDSAGGLRSHRLRA